MMSPMALRRTMSRLSNRGVPGRREKESVILIPSDPSRFFRPHPRPRARTNDLGGRGILGITHDDNPASTGFDLVALGDALHRVVGALGMKIRAYFADDRAHILFWKNYDSVHVRQRRQNFRAFFGRHHWPAFALQSAHGSVGIHCNDQLATELPSGTQVAYVANMRHVEHTVSQRDAIAGAPPICYTLLKFVARNNLRME